MSKETAGIERNPNKSARYLLGCCCLPTVLFLVVIVIGIQNREPYHFDIPPVHLPSPNGYNDFVKARQIVMQIPDPSLVSATATTTVRGVPVSQAQNVMPTRRHWRDSGPIASATQAHNVTVAPLAVTPLQPKAVAQAMEPVHKLLRSGFDKRYLFPATRSFDSLGMIDVLFRNSQHVMRVFDVETSYYQSIGSNTAAANVSLDAMQLGTMAPKGGPLYAVTISSAYNNFGARRLDRLIRSLSNVDLRHVADRLERDVALRVPFSENLVEESNKTTLELLEYKGESKQTFSLPPNVTTTDIIDCRDYGRATAIEARGPYRGAFVTPVPNNRFSAVIEWYAGPWRRATAAVAVQDLLRVETALYRFKAAHGMFPVKLGELSPTYLQAIPLDPFSCGTSAFVYRLAGGGKSFVLYSLGPDMRDNGGQPVNTPGDDPAVDPGDIVAGHL